MTEFINTKATNKNTSLLILAGALATVGICSFVYLAAQTPIARPGSSASPAPQLPQSVNAHHAPSPERVNNGLELNEFSTSESDKPFAKGEVQQRLQEFYDSWDSGHPMTRQQRDIFMSRLLSTIDSSPEARKAVADYYAKIPAQDAANREILQNMIVRSSTGRQMMVDEANRIWASKDTSLYAQMYKTYSNFPGTASKETLSQAMSSLNNHSNDVPTSVAALNFIGTIEEDTSADARGLRSNAIAQMNSLVSGDGDERVRALAAQKVYRLSSPDAAADAAVNYLRSGATEPLVRQTLNSIASGDVELTPPLRSTLTTAVSRPSASLEEREILQSLVQGHS